MNNYLGITLPQQRLDEARNGGFWQDKTILDYFDNNLLVVPNRIAIMDYNSMTGEQTRLTYKELDHRVTQIAVGISNLGIQPGDVVSYQLPNWWQFIALHLASVRIGVISNPIMPIFRERELKFMLHLAETKLLIVPEVFRGYDHASLANKLMEDIPSIRASLVIGVDGQGSFDQMLKNQVDQYSASTLFSKCRPNPDDVIQILYTSGSTGEPKGVMHTSNTLFCNLIQFCNTYQFSSSDITIMPSPMAHQLGFLFGVMAPILTESLVILQDIWNAEKALDLIEKEKVTFTISATPFLSDYCEVAKNRPGSTESLRSFVCAGAPIPPNLSRTARKTLGATIISMWGMTENGTASFTLPNDPPDKNVETDGIAVPSMECKVVNEEYQIQPSGVTGRLLVKGAGMFVGYLKRPELLNLDEQGWFDTGDLATMDSSGYIKITGRSKDIIIRGGENIPVLEIESLLYEHPDITSVAIVAVPDARLGERSCAFVTLIENSTFCFSQMVYYLERKNCTKQFMPEYFEIISDMPTTTSGKIQKFILRDRAKRLAPKEQKIDLNIN